MASFLAVNMRLITMLHSTGREETTDHPQTGCIVSLSPQEASSRRQVVLGCGRITLVSCLVPNWVLRQSPAWAGEEPNAEEDKDEGVVGTLISIFDPNEKTKSGKVLPKAYLKSAREVVKTLRDSLKEDPEDIAKFRRNADAAKESIRDYLNNWRGQKMVANEESYLMLERAIRSLASFYSRAGPSAPLPEEIKSEILSDLSNAEEFL